MVVMPYFLDVIFFMMLGLFVYFNVVAQDNFLKSNTIIIEDNDPTCDADVSKLKNVEVDKLTKCSGSENEWIIPFEEIGLKFIVTNEKGDAGNYNSICLNGYCSENMTTSGNCERIKTPITCDPDEEQTDPYVKCICLLNPERGCSNSSSAVAVDLDNNEIFWAVRATTESTC